MSSTLTGVCGLSWEVTMSVLPRLYIEEVLSELQRRKIAVAREKVRHSDLLRLLHEVMAEANSTARAPRGVLHKCMFCPFETRLKTNLQYHLRDHAEINVYRCGMCSFSAATKQTLDDHVATRHHEELPFMCGVCGYRTGVKENLSTHMWVVHKAGKSFQCSLCEYSTSYKTRLETHMINHHF
ncbi:uncharacterized protein LOC144866188 isoform X3 [Branchiostoma floridae x Branchiostoma japonicum]